MGESEPSLIHSIHTVLAKKSPASDWKAVVLNALHNGYNPSERRRVLQEHPGERECISSGRVIGYLAPTRGMLFG